MPDFNKFEGALAESFTYDAATLTWTNEAAPGRQGLHGATFNADDVVYTFARAKSVSGAAPIGWFLSNVGSIAGFTPDVFGQDPKAKELATRSRRSTTTRSRSSSPNPMRCSCRS